MEKYTRNFRNDTERFFKETVPQLIYADKPYYDFLLVRKFVGKAVFPYYIKVEALKMEYREFNNRLVHTIPFQIRGGEWRKVKKADYVVVADTYRIYFVNVAPLNEFIKQNMSETLLQRSHEPFRKNGKRTYFRRDIEKLQRQGLFRSILISEAHFLERLIQDDYEINCFSS